LCSCIACALLNAAALNVILQDHLDTCKLAVISCPHSTYGCKEQLPRSEMSIHVDKCQHKPVKCKWCHKNVLDITVSAI
jgi:hypothetical protein